VTYPGKNLKSLHLRDEPAERGCGKDQQEDAYDELSVLGFCRWHSFSVRQVQARDLRSPEQVLSGAQDGFVKGKAEK